MNLIDFSKDVCSITDVGLVRQANEDNCYAAETPNGFLFVVCDGMGGHVGGAKASAIAVNSIVNFFTKEKYVIVHQALVDALIFANRQILGVAAEYPELKGMGTTACVVLMRDDNVWLAHIGDSRIYLFCNKQQQLYRLTKDHSVVQGLVDQGVISDTEAERHPNKNQLLKTLGIKNNIQPEVCTMPVLPAKGDIFLICSDGLTGMVNDDILQHILEQKISLQEKGENMLMLAKQAGGTDNVTLQLIHVSNSPHQQSVFENKSSLYFGRPGSNHKKQKGNKYIQLTAIIALLAIISIFTLLWLGSGTKETIQSIPQTNTTIETAEKKAWEKKKDELGYIYLTTKNGKKIFGNKLIYNKEFSAMYVDSDGSYSIGIITIFKGSENFFWKSIEKYNKNGKEIQ